MLLPASIKNLIDEFSRLPGIGPKTSERLVFSLLRRPKQQIHDLKEALGEFSLEIHLCSKCYNFTSNGNQSICDICSDQKRDHATVCVVADSLDLMAIESAGYLGLYHILGGVINPLKGVRPEDLRVKELISRINSATSSKDDSLAIKEIILAFDPNQEGELTSHHLKSELSGLPLKITRLARGLPQGGDLDYADEVTLSEALKGRREV